MSKVQLTVRTFRADCTNKEQAVKVLEEASEAREAHQALRGLLDVRRELLGAGQTYVPSREMADLIDAHRALLADELADCITACCNLAERYGLDMQAALDRVERRNRERGRYA